jgi:phytol kinase
MLKLFITVLAIFILLVANEVWWRKQNKQGEISRKFIHITVGSFVAVWPFYLNWDQIRLMSLAFCVVVLLAKQLNLFKATRSVQRPTYGQILFAISVGILTFVTHNKWIYAAAILEMALCDGLAAVIGLKVGGKLKYRILGNTKSVAGTLTFFIVSVLVLIAYTNFSHMHLSIAWILLASSGASLIENVGIYGLDNLLVPLLVAVLLVHH